MKVACTLSILFMSILHAQALSLAAEMIVSVPEQKLVVIDRGNLIARYPISTAKFGVGDAPGSYRTPLGVLYTSACT